MNREPETADAGKGGGGGLFPVRWHAAAAEISEYGRRLIIDGLALGTAGNLSCRVDDHVVISPSSIPYDQVAPDDMWVLSLDGQIARTGSAVPSSEAPFHLAIYASTKAAAVVHTHSPEVVAVSATLETLPAIHYAIARLGGPVPVVSYRRFGSDSLAAGHPGGIGRTGKATLGGHPAEPWSRHLRINHGRGIRQGPPARMARPHLPSGQADRRAEDPVGRGA